MVELPQVLPFELPFTITLLLLLLMAKVLGEAIERLGHPALIGEILAGIILGPALLGYVHFSQELKVISELGLLFLVIHVGMEITIDQVRDSLRGRNAWIAITSYFIPLLAGVLLGFAFNMGLIVSLFMGLAVSITALPVSIRILLDMGKLGTRVGQRIISSAIFNDVLSFLFLGILLYIHTNADGMNKVFLTIALTVIKIGLFVLLIVFSYKVSQILMRKFPFIHNSVNRVLDFQRGKEWLFAIIILFVLSFAGISELLGLHFVVGSFFGAALVNKDFLGDENFTKAQSSISGVTMGFLAPVFFAALGVQFSFSAFSNPLFLVVTLLVMFSSKMLGGFTGARLAGMTKTESLTLAYGLNAHGIMELLVAQIALQNGIIDASVYSVLMLAAVVTTFITPFLLKNGFRRIDRQLRQAR